MKLNKTVFTEVNYLSMFPAIVLASIAGYTQSPQHPWLADSHMDEVPTHSAQEIATDLENASGTQQLAIHHNMLAVERLSRTTSIRTIIARLLRMHSLYIVQRANPAVYARSYEIVNTHL